MGKLLAVLVALTVLIGGSAAIALITSSDTAAAQDDTVTTTAAPEASVVATEDTEAEEAEDEATEGGATERADRVRTNRGDIVSTVLDDLVADGTITQEQADEIAATLAERTAAFREELRAQRREHGEGGVQSRGLRFLGGNAELLEDGVIDADELAALGENHPLNDPDGPAAQYLDDGQLTEDELNELVAELRGERSRNGDGN